MFAEINIMTKMVQFYETEPSLSTETLFFEISETEYKKILKKKEKSKWNDEDILKYLLTYLYHKLEPSFFIIDDIDGNNFTINNIVVHSFEELKELRNDCHSFKRIKCAIKHVQDYKVSNNFGITHVCLLPLSLAPNFFRLCNLLKANYENTIVDRNQKIIELFNMVI